MTAIRTDQNDIIYILGLWREEQIRLTTICKNVDGEILLTPKEAVRIARVLLRTAGDMIGGDPEDHEDD